MSFLDMFKKKNKSEDLQDPVELAPRDKPTKNAEPKVQASSNKRQLKTVRNLRRSSLKNEAESQVIKSSKLKVDNNPTKKKSLKLSPADLDTSSRSKSLTFKKPTEEPVAESAQPEVTPAVQEEPRAVTPPAPEKPTPVTLRKAASVAPVAPRTSIPQTPEPLADAPGKRSRKITLAPVTSTVGTKTTGGTIKNHFQTPPSAFKSPLSSEKPGELAETLIINHQLLLKVFPEKYINLSILSHSGKENFTAWIPKEEALQLLARGAFFLSVKKLAETIPHDFLNKTTFSDDEIIQFSLTDIMPLIPKEWLEVKNQSEEKIVILQETDDPFSLGKEPEPTVSDEPELIKPKTAVTEAFTQPLKAPLNVKSSDIDTLIAEHPFIGESERGLDRRSLGKKSNTPVTPVGKQTHSSDTLALPLKGVIEQIPISFIKNKNFKYDTSKTILLTKEQALESISKGRFDLSFRTLEPHFPIGTFTPPNKQDFLLDLPLSVILPHIPVDWFEQQGQNQSLCDVVENSSSPFASPTEKASPQNTARSRVKQDFEDDLDLEFEEDNKNNSPETPPAKASETSSELPKPPKGPQFHSSKSFKRKQDFEDDLELEFEEDDSSTIPHASVQETIIAPKPQAIPPVEEAKDQAIPPVEEATSQALFADHNSPAKASSLFDDEDDSPKSSPSTSSLFDDEAPVKSQKSAQSNTPAATNSLEEIKVDKTKTSIPKAPEATQPKLEAPSTNLSKIDQPTAPAEEVKFVEKAVQPKLEAPASKVDDQVLEEIPAQPKLQVPAAKQAEAPAETKARKKPKFRPSRAPNAININHAYEDEFTNLEGIDEDLAEAIIDYRDENDGFKSLEELLQVPGITKELYKSITGLEDGEEIIDKERGLNQLAGLKSERDYSLNKIITAVQQELDLESLILSGKNGFIIAASGEQRFHQTHCSLLAASCPQLFKKIEYFLTQSELPSPEIFSFNYEEHCISFAMGGEVFLILIHHGQFPERHTLNKSRDLIHQLSWYCSIRAVL